MSARLFFLDSDQAAIESIKKSIATDLTRAGLGEDIDREVKFTHRRAAALLRFAPAISKMITKRVLQMDDHHRACLTAVEARVSRLEFRICDGAAKDTSNALDYEPLRQKCREHETKIDGLTQKIAALTKQLAAVERKTLK